MRLTFAEVVFQKGDDPVVGLVEKARDPGLRSLVDFADGRKVGRVRGVARGESESAEVFLGQRRWAVRSLGCRGLAMSA